MADLLTNTGRLTWRADLRQATDWLIRDARRNGYVAAVVRISSCSDRVRGSAVDAAERALRSGVIRSGCLCLHDGGIAIGVLTSNREGALAVGARIKWAVTDAGYGVGIALANDALEHADAVVALEMDSAAAAHAASAGELVDATTLSASSSVDVAHALETGDLATWYQPVLHLATKLVIGAEAQPRSGNDGGIARLWDIGDGGSADSALANWLLRHSVSECRTLLNGQSVGFALSVRVCHHQLEDPNFCDTLVDVISGIHAHRLQLNLVDTGTRELSPSAVATLRLAKGLGVTLGLDEFGAGYQSLERLGAIDWGVVRIARNLTHHCGKRSRQQALVTAAVAAIEAVGAVSMAHGIENTADLDALHASGVVAGSGPLWGKPVNRDILLRNTK